MKVIIPSLLAATVAATPLYRAGKSPIETRDITVTASDVDALALYAQWAGSSYCNSVAKVGSAITCSDSVCTTLEANKATVLANLGSETSLTDMLGFIGYDPVKNQITLNFRGSSSARNWIEDFTFDLVACSKYLSAGLTASIGSGCQMHEGFGKAWTSLSADTLKGLAAAKATYPTAAIVVTGHSLGGAVATLVGAELRAAGYTVDLFTYGSPRVGNEALVKYLSTQGPVGTIGSSGVSNYRVTHTNDPVPQLPPIVLLNYAHTSPEFWLSDAGTPANSSEAGYFAGKVDYTPAEVKVCTGFESYDCNAGIPSVNVLAHLSYFEPISGCNANAISLK